MSTIEAPEKKYYSMQELADLTGRCYRTILRVVRYDKKIKSLTFGRAVVIPHDEVQRVLRHGWK